MAPQTRTFTRTGDGFSVSVDVAISGEDTRNAVMEYIEDFMRAEAKAQAIETFPDTPIDTLSLRINGKLFATGDFVSRLNAYAYRTGSTIEISDFSNFNIDEAADNLMLAFQRVMAAWHSNMSVIKRQTPFYSKYVTVWVNGKAEMPQRDKITPNTVIQIFTKARHAAALEKMKGGSLMIAAAQSAAGTPGVNVSFSYRARPAKYGQISDPPPRNPAYMAVPMIELGLSNSNVKNTIGQVGGEKGQRARLLGQTARKPRRRKAR
jgi:hypothetical protein